MKKSYLLAKLLLALVLFSSSVFAGAITNCPPASAFYYSKLKGHWVLKPEYTDKGWGMGPFVPNTDPDAILEPSLSVSVFLSAQSDTETIDCYYKCLGGNQVAAEMYSPGMFTNEDLIRIEKHNSSFTDSPPDIECHAENKNVQTKCYWGY